MRKIMIGHIVKALFFLTTSLYAYEDYSKLAELYATNQIAGTDYLAFRDIPMLIKRYIPLRKNLSVLDYGCGSGLSTRFIKQVLPKDAHVVGVDISNDMLQQALLADPKGSYLKMDQVIPCSNSTFDLVYCNFVLFELPTREEIIRVFTEVRRTMKNDGYLIATTGTPEMYKRCNHWSTLDANFPENDQLQSGSIAKVSCSLPNGMITFNDYYWTENDYRECFDGAGFSLISVTYPLGSEDEVLNWKWKDETKAAPYVIFILKNKKSD
jgi:ubiquinone/menaquinone biosynthesis C-methylase UbiE